jgi:hypothetical protein
LMEKNGLYARLYSMQFRNPEEELELALAQSNRNNSPQVEEKSPKPSGGLLTALLGRSE